MNKQTIMWRFFLVAGLSAWWLTQVVGQSCGLSDTLFINNNSSPSFTLPIADYFNNNLADPNQGLCAVEIHFVHQFVDNLELWLVSPAGQSAQLIGPNTTEQFAFTFFARWRITFVPLAENPVPDFPSGDRWDNEQIGNFVNGGLYTGSYHPFNGNLEDFNTGPVNGNWTIEVRNNPSNYPGAITFVRLFFCDSRGVDCCFANAGNLLNQDLLACTGAETLQLTPTPSFTGAVADTAEYRYTYLLAQDGILLGYDSLPDLRTFPAGNYQVCGLSYRGSQRDSFPLPDGLLTVDSLRRNLDGLTPGFCAQLTDTCMSIVIATPPDTTFLQRTVCPGDFVDIGPNRYDQAGRYWTVLPGYASCDSVVQLDLTLAATPEVTIDTLVCAGETVQVGNQTFAASGNYTTVLPTVGLGCDSTVYLNLTVVDPIFVDSVAVICAGQSLAIGDSLYNITGLYETLLVSSQGCDSTVRLDLTVLDPAAVILPPDPIDCLNQGIVLNGANSSPAGPLTYTWLNPLGDVLGSAASLPVDSAGTFTLRVSQTLLNRSCSAEAQVTVVDLRAQPVADAGMPDTLTCQLTTTSLGGPTTSLGPIFSYQWQTPDGRLVGPANLPTATADAAGRYTLVVTDLSNGCRDTAVVDVAIDTLLPRVDPGLGFTLNCAVSSDTLDGQNSELGANFAANWSGPACLTPLPSPAQALADCPGWYVLTVRNLRTGCEASDSVRVDADLTPPNAIVAPALSLNCLRDTVLLDATASQPAGQLAFSWNGPSLSSFADLALSSANEPGRYTVTVTSLLNACQDTASVLVPIDTLYPVADPGPDTSLTCFFPVITLGGPATSLGNRYVYNWRDFNDTPLGNANTLQVNGPGLYYLTVRDTVNGCTKDSFVVVTTNFTAPPVNAGPDQFLDCASTLVTLAGDSTLYGGPVAPLWSGPCPSGPLNAWTIRADCPGIYTLTVTDLSNGCSRSDQVEIGLLNNATVAVLPDTIDLSCATGMATISTTGSSQGVYSWFLNDIQLGLPFPNPIVDQPGTYTLVVENFNQTCADTAQVVVRINCILEASVLTPDTLTCLRQSVWLDGRASTSGPNVVYQWLPPAAGCIINGANTTQAEVVCAGEYALVLTQTAVDITDTFRIMVAADTLRPTAEAGLPDTLTCSTYRVELDGSASSQGSNFLYWWTNNLGDTIGLQPLLEVSEPGLYILEVYNSDNGCSAFDQTSVRQDDNVPVIAFGSDVFPCLSDTFRMEAFVTPPLATYQYVWTGTGILGANNQPTVLVDTTGTYQLSVIDPLTGCADTAQINLQTQQCVPCLEWIATDTLDCQTATVELIADFCLPCLGCVLQWRRGNTPIPGAEALNLTVTQPGFYSLVATDTLGFTNVLTVEVPLLVAPPHADAGPHRILTCDSTEVTLGGPNLELGPSISYSWRSLAGAPISDATAPYPTTSAPDSFILTVVNLLTGCAASDTTVVGRDTLLPLAEAGSTDSLTCNSTFVALNGAGSSTGAFAYNWTGPDANCILGGTTLNPITNCPGLHTLTVTSLANGCTASDTVTVLNAATPPPLTTLPDTSLTCAQPALDLVAADPGPGNFSFRWCALDASGQEIPASCVNNLALAVSAPGRYRFSLRNLDSGCQNSFGVTVSTNQTPPAVDAGAPATLGCNLDSLQLNGSATPANPGLQYAWTAGAGLSLSDSLVANPFVYAPGWYYLQVTDPRNGCAATDSVRIGADLSVPDVNAGTDTLLNCLNTTLVLTGVANTNPGDPVSWQWDGPPNGIVSGGNGPNPTVAQPGWYVLTVNNTNSGCAATDSVWVDADYRQPAAVLANLPELQLDCRTDTLTFDAQASRDSTGAGLGFNWQVTGSGRIFPALNLPVVFTNQAGSYRLIVTDQGNGCRDTLNFVVSLDRTPPQVALPIPDALTCDRLEVSLTPSSPSPAPEYRYTWRLLADGSLLAVTPTITVAEPGPYVLSVVNDLNGCSDSVTVQIPLDRAAPNVVLATPNNLDCTRDTVILDGSASSTGPGWVYTWSNPNGSPLPLGSNPLLNQATQAGNYVLHILNPANGCFGADTVAVQANGTPIAGIELLALSPPCFGDLLGSLEILNITGGTPPFLFALNDGPFTPSPFFEDLPVGTYVLRLTDDAGCTRAETVRILPAEQLTLSLGDDQVVALGDSIRLEALLNIPAYDTLIWQSGGPIPSPGAPVQVISPQEGFYYVATVVDENGCTASDTVRIAVEKNLRVYIPTAFSPNGDGQNDRFTIFAGDEVTAIQTLRIFDRWGNMVFRRDNFAPNDPLLGWDGNFAGRPVNAAVFVYYAEVLTITNAIEPLQGEVIILR